MTVFIDRRAGDALGAESRRRRVRETGGALFGFADGDHVVVACAYGPGPHARHRHTSFESHRPTTDAIMATVREASTQRYRFLGSWHTHPAGAAVPSSRDTATAAEIAAEAEVLLPRPLVIIQATRPRVRGAGLAELAAWRWDPGASEMVREALESVDLEERWCPVVAAPGSDPPSMIRG
ncbi:MAG TPA: Mov34/MPN/PAD-1 family protein [Solirubrobacteraceae bacterium]|nr:Mov34/MPN/PAD-1 family protein [Solirubrobacteraceae bacterium]